jgi:hypothetical protein
MENAWQPAGTGVFDGPVVELFSNAGIFAAPIPVTGPRTISTTDSECVICEL